MNIPSDQVTALHETYAHFGRKAKGKIRDAWLTGDYSEFPSHINTGHLQNFRNQAHGGPTTLSRISLKKLAENLAI